VRRVGEPAKISIGPPAQRLFGSWRLVLERFQLGNLVQEDRKFAVFRAGNLRAIIQIGMYGKTRRQRRSQRDDRKKPSNPYAVPPTATTPEPRYSRRHPRLSDLNRRARCRILPIELS
jgi:hypothetical protein